MQLGEKSGFIEDPELLCVTFYPWSTWYTTRAIFLDTLLMFFWHLFHASTISQRSKDIHVVLQIFLCVGVSIIF